MHGGRWLARQTMEMMRDQEGQGAMAQHGQREVIHNADQSSPAPSCYPILWRLSPASLVELAGAGGLSVAELIEHGARRAQA